MRSITSLINNLTAVNMQDIVAQSIDATRFDFVKFQKYQMMMGYRANGDRIGKYRNKSYAAMKFAQNPLAGYGWIDLRLEGYFQDDIFIDVRSNSVVISSMDEKTNDLIDRYGPSIFGLNQPSAEEYAVLYLQPEGVTQIKNQILK